LIMPIMGEANLARTTVVLRHKGKYSHNAKADRLAPNFLRSDYGRWYF
jgi:hypothetical protein